MPHRDEPASCPRCQSGLEPVGRRLTCGQCRGVLVTTAELETMMNEMSPDDERPLAQRLLSAIGPQRPCPRCPALMTTWTLYQVPLDLCGEHGVWFDGDELARVLQANGEAFAARNHEAAPSSSLGGILGSTIRALFDPWLKRRRLRKDIERTSPKPPKRQP